jgi:hypothetical protein
MLNVLFELLETVLVRPIIRMALFVIIIYIVIKYSVPLTEFFFSGTFF